MGAFDDDLPAGYHDADLETRELEELARYGDGDAPPSPTMSTTLERAAALEREPLERFDVHENGQLRVGAAGDQLELLELANSLIPDSDGPPLTSAAVEELEREARDRASVARRMKKQRRADWAPAYFPSRHGGWYVYNLCYPSGAVGCVSRNYPDRKWRIACDPRPFDEVPTFPNRDAAAYGERELIEELATRGLEEV